MAVPINLALERAFGNDPQIRILHVQEFNPGDPLIPLTEQVNNSSRRVSNGVIVVKLFLRTSGSAPEYPSPDAGTDIGMEIWLPDVKVWNSRLRVQVHGGFMGDFRVTSKNHFSLPVCTDMLSGELASELGYVVAISDGGHAARNFEDFQYLMAADGSINNEGWKNVAYQATHLLGLKSRELASLYYNKPVTYSYLYGCSTGGRQAYHSAQKYPGDFDGILAGCPSIRQSLLFPSLIHPHIVIQNDLGGDPFKKGQLEMISQKALGAGDTEVNGSHDGYITDWLNNSYDPTKDLTVLSVKDGGHCTESWALSMAQAQAINKIWYGPTLDGGIPDPAQDNGSGYQLSKNQLWWGKLRGTRIDFSTIVREAATGILALSFQDSSLASPAWVHPTGCGQDRWKLWTYAEYAQAMMQCQLMNETFENMDAADPDLRQIQHLGKKILVYHGLADPVVAPQSAISYFHESTKWTGGMEKTKQFHRLFLIPGMGHCIRYRGCAGGTTPPIPTLEELFEALVAWVEEGKAPETLIAHSTDNKVSRPLYAYPKIATYVRGDVNSASSYA